MSMDGRARCGLCGKRCREEDTARVQGHVGGNYRRGARLIWRRVCRECTECHLRYVRRAQAEGRSAPVDTHAFSWSYACREFGIDIAGLYRTAWSREPET